MSYYCYVYYDERWEAFYVGKGQKSRAYQSQIHPELPPKERIQRFDFAEEWLAYECEIELIAFWGRQCDGGSLLNKSTGGPGCPGIKWNQTESMKTSMSIHKKQFNNFKQYEITFPNGDSKTITGLRAFAREHKLAASSLCEVAKGKRKSYKGYEVRPLGVTIKER